MTAALPSPRYLGDGVYGSYDGYQVWLGLREGEQLIALEPSVMISLAEYWTDIRHYYKKHAEGTGHDDAARPEN